MRVVDAALAIACERKRVARRPELIDYSIDVLLDIRNNVMRDMTNEPPSGGSSS